METLACSLKRCAGCGEEKPPSSFCRNRRLPDGLNNRCRECAKQQAANWWAAHPEKHRAFKDRQNAKKSCLDRAATVQRREQERLAASYISEKLCRKCKIVKLLNDFGRSKWCRACIREKFREWKRSHPERCRELKRAYRKRSIRHQESSKKYRLRPENKARKREWESRPENKLKKKLRDRARVESPGSKARRREREAVWRKSDVYRELRKARKLLRRARMANNGPHEKFKPIEIYERDGWLCGICGGKVDRMKVCPHDDSPSLDHVVPLAKGGAHTRANVQLAHFACNWKKRDQPDLLF